MINKKNIAIGAFIALATVALSAPAVYAQTTAGSTLTQAINSGAVSTDFRDAANAVVASPSFPLNAATVSTQQQSITGIFGSSTQRISVDNPGNAGGWSLAIAATAGDTALWTSGGNTYDFNGTAAAGRLTLDPSVGTITVTGPSTMTGVTKGTSTAFTTGAITLMSASASSDDVWNGYLTGVGITQTIPAFQPTGAYTLSLTQTVTAL